jgi:hypothetical protein
MRKFLSFICLLVVGSYLNGQQKCFFDYTGSDQTYTVPPGVTSITVKMWGAGGGGSDNRDGGNGGGGAYVTGTLTVTPGEVLTIVVGQGGHAGVKDDASSYNPVVYGGGGRGRRDNRGGGSGGGFSGIFRGAVSQANALGIAAGGGGAGGSGQQSGSTLDRYRGGGGSAINGIGTASTAAGGPGGGHVTGNNYTCGSSANALHDNCSNNGPDGSALQGGNGQNTDLTYGGGGGGGGYWGGEGGRGRNNDINTGSQGGAGGASFF